MLGAPDETPEELAEHLLKAHGKSPRGDWCFFCGCAWPCPPVRAARALKEGER